MKTPPTSFFFFNFVQSTIPLTLFVALLFWLNVQPCQICYFAEWYYGPKLVEPLYCSTCSTLLCILCNKTSSLMKGLIWMTWFLQEIWFGITQSHTGHKGNNRLTHTHTHTRVFQIALKGGRNVKFCLEGSVWLRGRDSWFTTRFWIFMTDFFVIMSLWSVASK